jgi:hypothetical protein
MSNLLEQAIADAAALREQAIKNAEQSVLDKYSKQIKEAVDKMLEVDEDPMAKVNEIIEEAEGELPQDNAFQNNYVDESDMEEVEAPPSWLPDDSPMKDMAMKITAMIDQLPTDEDGYVEIDLGNLNKQEPSEMGGEDSGIGGGFEKPEAGGFDDLFGGSEGGEEPTDLDLGSPQGIAEAKEKEEDSEEESDEQLKEILDMLNEEVHVDLADEDLLATGNWLQNGPSNRKAQAQELKAQRQMKEEDEDSSSDEEWPFEENSLEEESSSDEEVLGKTNELHEMINGLNNENKQIKDVLGKLEIHLEETLLSNAKLLYQNRTLSDASLNERQKQKIVEAIANAESPKEAKHLFETLKATVGTTPTKKAPQSLSESITRKSTLGSMLNPRQNINEGKSEENEMKDFMQRLAGINKK